MLAQILKEMYVDPDLLAELPEEQKQILFVKMREEQVRRYNEWEKELEEVNNVIKPKKAHAKTVHYLMAKDGNPWVWVMEDDIDLEKIRKEQEMREDQLAEQKAMEQAHKEAEELLRKEQERLEEEERRLKEEQERLEREEAKKEAKMKKLQEEARQLAIKAAEDKKRLEEEKRQAERKKREERRKLEEERKREQEARRKAEQEKAAKAKAEMEERMRKLEERKREAERKAEEKRREHLKELEKKRQEEEMRKLEAQRKEELRKYEEMKKAEELARQKEEEERRLQQEREDKLRREKEEEERLQREKEEKRRREEEARLKQIEEERRILEEQRKLEEERREKDRQRKEELKRLREQRLAEKQKREEELVQQEKRRAQEIYLSLKTVREEVKKKEEEEQKKVDEAWKVSELKAKEAEKERRNSVSLARREVLRERAIAAKRRNTLGKTITIEAPPTSSPTLSTHRGSISIKPSRAPPPVPNHPPPSIPNKPPLVKARSTSPPPRPPPPRRASLKAATLPIKSVDRPERPQRNRKPRSRADVIEWFREEELPKRACFVGDSILPYFHGIVSRQDAEEVLLDKPVGSFLVRVSERVWGYTITYRSQERCKHYLIDTSENTYQFFGHNQIAHPTLNDLIEFHKVRPISGQGQELLQHPCGQTRDQPDYEELLKPPENKEMTYL